MCSIFHLPDIHEVGEANAERYMQGEGLKCAACGKIFNAGDTTWFPSGPSPYAPPICEKCYWEDYD